MNATQRPRDASLTAEAAEAAWRIVEAVLGNQSPLSEYEPNT